MEECFLLSAASHTKSFFLPSLPHGSLAFVFRFHVEIMLPRKQLMLLVFCFCKAYTYICFSFLYFEDVKGEFPCRPLAHWILDNSGLEVFAYS